MAILSRVRNAWNVFRQTETPPDEFSLGPPAYSASSPSSPRRTFSNERTIITSIYTRIAVDVAQVVYRHVKLDDNERYLHDVDSPLNRCLTFEANLDQGPRDLRQDIALTLFDKGVAAIVPVDTTIDPKSREIIDIFSLRIGEITGWYPKNVKVSVYNEETGRRQEVILEKKNVAIAQNPLFPVMNEINSTYNRIVKKLSFLDAVDEQTASGKLDLIIQLPYVIKTDARKQQATQRREEIEMQLRGSKYGIAYADGTEKITQLNRPAENNLLKQIEYLVDLLYSQLGITAEVMNGTADEKTMINYFNRTIEPIVESVKESMQRTFLGPVKFGKKERILYFKDAFKLVPMEQLAEIADKFTRNEILSSNEIRGLVGFKPSNDPKADALVNSNMPQPPGAPGGAPAAPDFGAMDEVMNKVLDGLSSDMDELVKQLANE